MIVLRVELNGELVAEGGRDDLCVLSAIIGAAGVLGPESSGTKTEKEKPELRLNLGGLGARSEDDSGTHYNWIPQKHLAIGDQVVVTISEQECADKAVESKPSKSSEDLAKEHWQRSKQHYFELKDKYENEN